MRPDGSGLDSIVTNGGATMPSPSPDGRSLAYVSTGALIIQDLQNGATRTIPNTGFAQAPRWSPNGAWIAFTLVPNGIAIIRPDGTGLRTHARDFGPGIYWSPDSRWIVGSSYARLTLLDISTGLFQALPIYGAYPAWQR